MKNRIDLVLGEYFCRSNSIDKEMDYRIEWVSARELLVPQRIDLIAKYKYVEHFEKGYDLVFIKKVYKEHIEAFSFGTFSEAGNPTKNTFSKYVETFEFLIKDIKCNGLDPQKSVIPVGKNDVILDGAHRTAIAAYFNLDVPIIRFPEIEVNYDSEFFKIRKLDTRILDFLVYEYCKIKEIGFLIVLNDTQNLKGITESNQHTNHLMYYKNVDISLSAFPLFSECINERRTYKFMVFESEINSLFINNQEFLPISAEEHHYLLATLLHQTTLDLLYGNTYSENTSFINELANLSIELNKNNISLDEVVVSWQGFLKLFNVECLESVKLLSLNDNLTSELLDSDFPIYSGVLLNPESYLFYNGFKVINLEAINRYSKFSSISKKKEVIKKIPRYISMYDRSLKQIEKKRFFKLKFRNLRYSFKPFLKRLVVKFGLYNLLKKIYLRTKS